VAPAINLDNTLPPDLSGAFSGNGQVEARDPSDLVALRARQEQDWAAMGIDPSKSLENDPGRLTGAEDERREELRQAAIAYAERGWRVIPVRWVDDEGVCQQCPQVAQWGECHSPGKHPVHPKWPDLATSDPDKAARWWRPEPAEGYMAEEWFPRANVGIVTGKGSGIWVLDVDPKADPRLDGETTLAVLEREHGEMPLTRTHQTGSGGRHHIFRHPGFEVRRSVRKLLGPGLDVMGEASFIVAPPSVSARGSYECSNPAQDIDPVDAPAWLVGILRSHNDRQLGEGVPGEHADAALPFRRKYAQAALRNDSEALRNAPAGRRNDMLNECAFSLGTLGGAGLLDEEDAWRTLHEAALACGLSEPEIRPTFLSGWRKGLEKPRKIEWHVAGHEYPMRKWNDLGNADRMVDHFGEILRWCPDRGTWMEYMAGRWTAATPDSGGWHAVAMIESIPLTEALNYDDEPEVDDKGKELPSRRKQFLAWASRQENLKSISAAAQLAKSRTAMRIRQDTFDRNLLWLNNLSGVVDLGADKNELIPHDPEQRMTMQCPVPYDPDARAPKWEAFLDRMQPDPEMRAYLRRVMGYTATGLIDEQVMFLHYGEGANGKTVFREVTSHVLGSYAQTVPVDTLLTRRTEGGIPNDVARMNGKRYLAASETKAGKSLDEQMIKQLAGGDTVSARFLHAEFFDFRVVGKIHLLTNHLPHLSDDYASWRRLQLIRWGITIPEHERDGSLVETLIREEAAGILAWIVRGAREWRETGLRLPASAEQAKAEYRRDEDTIGRFIADCLAESEQVRGAADRSTKAIYGSYRLWCSDQGLREPMTQHRLTRAIQDHENSLGQKHEYVKANSWAGFPCLAVRAR